jgi:hypothetical protein
VHEALVLGGTSDMHDTRDSIMIGGRLIAAFALAIAASTVVACDGDDDEWRTVVVENSGPVCLTSDNGMLNARVSIDACVNAICRKELATVCQAAVSSGRITLTSKAEILEATDERDCPDGCGPAVAACSVALPVDGSYTVVHGSDQADVTIPLSGSIPLFANNACL